jgi:pimeloyl-ACP methyl ester carboxylesterase
MSANSELRHCQVDLGATSVHVVDGGRPGPALLFLHGWPESWSMYEPTMIALSDRARVVAIDLPGVGASRGLPADGRKSTLAHLVQALIERLQLRDVILVGHDAGGMIAFAHLREHPGALRAAVIMNTVIPGVDPWDDVIRNPRVWHFAFHAIPRLPERLVTDRQAEYFAYFYDVLQGPHPVSAAVRQRHVEAYLRPEALTAGFDWYRALETDAQENREPREVTTPVLYVRGDREPVDPQRYLAGLRAAGLASVQARIIPGCGHFLPDERPERLTATLDDFLTTLA